MLSWWYFFILFFRFDLNICPLDFLYGSLALLLFLIIKVPRFIVRVFFAMINIGSGIG